MSHTVSRAKWWGFSTVGWAVALVMLLALLVAMPRIAYAQDEAIDPDTEAAVSESLEAIFAAFVDVDVDALDALTAQDFVNIDASGMVADRDGWLEFASLGGTSEFSVRDASMRELAPGAVLVTAILDISGTFGDQEWQSSELDTITFVEEDGEWKIASVHSTAVPTEAEALQQRIDLALSAAPASISAGATIVEPGPDGSATLLQEGDNGFVCIPDDPSTPVEDPICLDAEWQAWIDAFFAGEEPVVQGPGISYILQGGAVASVTDPLATEPAEGEEWVIEGPSMMLLLPGGFDEELFSTDPASGLPFIVYSGTPYEYLVVPVADAAEDEAMEELE